MANISDVAKLAGFSVSTVSRVINNKQYVSQEKRDAVYAAMNELNYIPSSAAQQLRGVSSKVIGVIVPHINNPYFSNLVNVIQQELYEHQYQLMIFQSDEDQEKEKNFFDLLLNKQLDGIIMCSRENSEETIANYLAYGPILMCNEPFRETKIPTLALDQFQGAYVGTEFLIKAGYKRIAYCTGMDSIYHEKSIDRTNGFLSALKDYNIEFNQEFVFTNLHSIEDGKKLLHIFLGLKEKPDAIFTGSDQVAAGFVIEANKNNLQIPQDVSILGFDNQPLAELTSPAITTVEQPVNLLGKNVVSYLMNLLGDHNHQVNSDILMKIVERETA